ncbi:MAG: hypothetical protein WDZ35_09780 [Crocinitomicaceae bacterium]
MKKILFFILFLGMATTGFSQEEEKEKPSFKHYLGVHAGLTTGLGFSYRYWPGKLGFQLTGIPVFYSSENTSTFFSSFGISVLMNIKEFSKVSIFSYLGNHMIYNRDTYYDYYYDPITYETVKSDTKTVNENINYNIALGVGLKVNFWEVMDFNLQAGYGVLTSLNNESFRSSFSGEAGLYYHF